MRNSLPLLVLVAALVGAAAPGILVPSSRTESMPPAALVVGPVPEDGRLEALMSRLESALIRFEERTALEAPAPEGARVPAAGGPGDGRWPEGLESLVEQLASLEERLASALRAGLPASDLAVGALPRRSAPTDWTTFHGFFGPGDLATDRENLHAHFLLASLGEVVQELGRPTAVAPKDSGLLLQYKQEERWINLTFHHGYVTNVSVGGKD